MAYTVQCPSCSTEFPVDPAKVPEDGVNARCSSCAEVFYVEKPAGEPEGGVAAIESPVEVPADEVGLEEPAPEEPTAEEAAAGAVEAPPEEESGEPAFAESPEAAPPEFSSETAAEEEVGVADDDFVLEQETLYTEEEEETPGPEAGTEVEVEEPEAAPEAETGLEVEEEAPAEEEAAAEAEETPSGEAPAALAGTGGETPSPGTVQFGRRSPEDKAKRLARVLVSDMILYNPDRHTRAMENDNLAEEFEDEIKKSWEEYVEQVGEDLADSTSYFTDALNEILAKGEEIF